MIVQGIKTPLITPGTRLEEVVLSALKREGLNLKDGDILVVASKLVSTCEGRVVKLSEVKPSAEAKKLSKKYGLKPEFVEVVLREADDVLGGVFRALLTIKHGVLIANAGADLSNAPPGHAVLWPRNPQRAAQRLKQSLSSAFNVRIAVIIADSRTTPLRLGTTGLAIAVAGLTPVRDYRGRLDLYGVALQVTRVNTADDLASAAHLAMGESAERTPLALIRDHGLQLTEGKANPKMKIPWDQCLYMKVLRESFKKSPSSRRISRRRNP
ncbi:MAG: coenzyme F420-0:L-glutamate ligase [Candidatus Bathyarchaeia archaeon]